MFIAKTLRNNRWTKNACILKFDFFFSRNQARLYLWVLIFVNQLLKALQNPHKLIFWIISLWFIWEVANHLPTNVLSYDVYGSYLHLPANFIYDDPFLMDWTWIEIMNEKYNSTPSYYQFWYADTGRQVIKYPLGFALIYAPFFFVGHVLAPFFGYEQDGFSAPYHWAVIIGHAFYVLLGLWMTRRVLRRFFSERLTALLLLLLFAGTNFFFTTTASLAMPHGHLFLFYALVLWFTMQWHAHPSWKNSLFLGASIGLAALIRATEILVVLLPLLWQIKDRKSLFLKWDLIKSQKKKVVFMVIVVAAFGSIQLIYYKLATGRFFIDAYNNAGEGFDFLGPYTWQFLFSARKGWLVYTPIFIASLLGFWFMYKQKQFAFYALFLFTLINLYVLSSWTCWWYAESFGQRSLVQSYLVLLLPMGYFLQWAFRQTKPVKSVLFGTVFLFVGFNQFQTWQVHHGLLHPSRMTKDAYWAHFLKTSPVHNFKELLLTDKSVPAAERLEKQKDQLTLVKALRFTFNAEQWTASNINANNELIGALTDDTQIYSKDLVVKYPELTKEKNVIFHFAAQVFCMGDPKEIQPRVVLKMRHKGKPYYDHYIRVEELENIEPFRWNRVELVFYSTDVRNLKKDEVQIFAWLAGQGSFKMDDLQLNVYEGLR